jgi:SAM-dependent methyltransferase
MSSYGVFATYYDGLTQNVGYAQRCDRLCELLDKYGAKPKLVLDLACGTGTMTWILTSRGYEMIGVDASAAMLAAAMEKSGCVEGVAPIFLHQSMPKLELYGTVDAAICCLDSLNYLTNPKDVQRTFDRLRLFIAPGGVLIFDINTVEKLAALDGQVFLDETEDTYCVWRAEYSKRSRVCSYFMDIFRLDEETGLWERGEELHEEYAYTPQELEEYLRQAGFTDIRQYGNLKLRAPLPGEDRIFFTARKDK